MATTLTAGTMRIVIREEPVSGIGDLGDSHALELASIKHIDRRTVTVLTTTNGTELLQMSTAAGAGVFIGANVRYVRVTNLDDTNYVTLHVQSASKYVQHKLEAGRSYLLTANKIDNASDIDSTSLADVTSIQALANTASVDVAVVVAVV